LSWPAWGVSKTDTIQEEAKDFLGRHHRRGDEQVVVANVQVRAKSAILVGMAWRVEVEAQKRSTACRWHPDLEVVSEERETFAALSRRRRKVEPGTVTAREVPAGAVAIEILIASDDGKRAFAFRQGMKLTGYRWRRLDLNDFFEDFRRGIAQPSHVRRSFEQSSDVAQQPLWRSGQLEAPSQKMIL
jgi:hypothetical protein